MTEFFRKNYPALITIETPFADNGHNVYINGQLAYYRPCDGSDYQEVVDEACAALGALIRNHLGLPQEPPGDNQ